MVLHALGIPLIPVAGIVAVLQLLDGAWSLWWRPVALLAVSYGLQGIGHLIEGNDMGELILVKKLLGKPYMAVSPRYARPTEGISTTEKHNPAETDAAREPQDGTNATTL